MQQVLGREYVSDRSLVSVLRGGGLGVVYLPDQGYGSLVFAAATASLDQMQFAHRHGSGIIIVSLTSARLQQLKLEVIDTRFSRSPAFTVSVDAASGTTTGISAADRLATVRALIDPRIVPGDLARPGHVFPIHHNPAWSTHAADLALHFSSRPGREAAGVATALIDDTGDVLDLERSALFARQYGLPYWSIPKRTIREDGSLMPFVTPIARH